MTCGKAPWQKHSLLKGFKHRLVAKAVRKLMRKGRAKDAVQLLRHALSMVAYDSVSQWKQAPHPSLRTALGGALLAAGSEHRGAALAQFVIAARPAQTPFAPCDNPGTKMHMSVASTSLA